MRIEDTVDNAEHKEPLVKVCSVNVENLINAHYQMQLPKTDGTVSTKRETAAHITLNKM